MTVLIDDSCSTALPAAPVLGPSLDGPGNHRAWVMAAFLLGAMARAALSDPDAGLGQRPLGAAALTHGETRVLHYLPTNLSAREIAQELHLSVNTIKTHQRHLYQKLGACSRSQAVERARTLGLLAPPLRRRRPEYRAR
jgi:ATP/maltotriose-dependent transcriptional regulator MalT